MMRDHRDLTISGATPAALVHYEQALAAFNCYRGDPVGLVDAALAESPDFVMAHALKASLYLSGTEQPAASAAAAMLAQAQSLPANAREQLLLAALHSLATGGFTAAAERFDALLADHPRDLVALQIAHLFDFNRGDATRLRERPAQVLKAFPRELPGHHAVLGMHAFGLEENGAYDLALDQGHAALAANPKDAWAHHAVAHVFEMRGDQPKGIAWMRDRESEWSPDNLMAVHNWWHLALFHLDNNEASTALALYDERIRRDSKIVLELIDATAMLWRMHLRGIEVGNRFQALADVWAEHEADDFYAFNTWHGALTAIAADRWDTVSAHLARLQRTASRGGDNQRMINLVTLPLVHGVIHFARREYSQAAEKLAAARPVAHQFGGSHAQRDLITLTLLEALKRAGDEEAVTALARQRLEHRPGDRVARHYLEATVS